MNAVFPAKQCAFSPRARPREAGRSGCSITPSGGRSMRRHLLSRSSVVGLVAAAFFAPAMAAAQGTASISGTVTDSASGRPIPSVQVTVVGTTRGAVTDDAGRYALRGLNDGPLTLRVQRIGYAPRSRAVTLASGAAIEENFT